VLFYLLAVPVHHAFEMTLPLVDNRHKFTMTSKKQKLTGKTNK